MSGQRVDVKVVMLGKEYVGKTSLVERYVHDRFLAGPYQNVSGSARARAGGRAGGDPHARALTLPRAAPQTIGAAFVAKVMSVGDRTVTLGIWVSGPGAPGGGRASPHAGPNRLPASRTPRAPSATRP